MMARRLELPWSLLLCAAGLCAQGDVPRQVHPGRVVDANDKPVAGAWVTFVSAPRLGADAGDDDTVRATTGADGRYRVDLVPTRSYRAWASAVDGERAFVSALVPRRPGATELQLERDAEPQRVGRVEGAEGWREHGPLRVQVVVDGSRTAAAEAEVAADGSFRVPALPRVDLPCRVFARDRLVWVSPEAPLGTPLVLPRPWLVPVRVVDAQGGPIAEAGLGREFSRAATQWTVFPIAPQIDEWPLAFTGADGCCDVLLASDVDPFRVDRFRSPAAASLGLAATKGTLAATAAPQWIDGRLQFQVSPSPGAARTWPLATCSVRTAGGDRTGSMMVDAAVPADRALQKRGEWVRTGPQFAYLWPLAVERPGADAFARSAVPMPVLLPAAALQRDAAREVVPLCLQLLDATGGPAAQALVCLAPLAGNRFLDFALAMRAATDEAGRLVVPCAPGPWMLVGYREDGVVAQRLDVARGMAPAELRLQSLPCMRVRATRGIGKAAAGVRFELAFTAAFAGGPAEDYSMLEVAQTVTRWGLSQVRTDADGRADLPVFERPPLQLLVRVVGERDAVPMALQPGSEIVPLVVK